MNIKLLIDSIMRQTTVLIAQLSTAAGVRAPLAHVADQVFLQLAREIEAQGVGRKVVADMFGMALRGYQLKTQRLAESQSRQGKTLFEAVLQFIEEQGSVSRSEVLRRFVHDGERPTVGVLTDLVSSGLVHTAGRGATALFGATSVAERQRLTRESDLAALSDMLWGAIYRQPGLTQPELAESLLLDGTALDVALATLVTDGRVTRNEDGTYNAKGYHIPVGSEHGWESAVFDHFQAVATAIGAKLASLETNPTRPTSTAKPEHLGGTTLRFQLSPRHPHEARVLGLLAETRTRLNALWTEVSDYNDAHPIAESDRVDVTFYFGQNVSPAASNAEEQHQ